MGARPLLQYNSGFKIIFLQWDLLLAHMYNGRRGSCKSMCLYIEERGLTSLGMKERLMYDCYDCYV